MIRTMGETGGLADPIVIDAVIGDVRLVGEGGPGAEHEGVLAHGFHRLRKVDRHEPPRHLLVGLFLRVVLLAPEVSKVLGQQFTAPHAAAVVIQIVVHDVGVVGVYTRVFVVLVFRTVALVVLVKYVVVVHERIRRLREKFQEELLHLRVVHALDFRRVVEVLALGLTVRQ